MPALPPYIIELICQQFEPLLPSGEEANHPLSCHRPRIPDRIVFEKLVQVLVFGCAYRRIADEEYSATTLHRRRDECIVAGAREALEELALESYERCIGLESADVAVDGCITKALCGGEKAGRSPVDRGKRGINRSTMVDANGIPLIRAVSAPTNRHDSPALGSHAGCPGGAGVAARVGKRASRPRLRFGRYPPTAGGPKVDRGDSREVQVSPA